MKECCDKKSCQAERSCECNCYNKSCGNSSSAKVCANKCQEKSQRFLKLADCAWMEVLKEKIKDHIRATKSERLTELAKIISEANSHCWKHKMEKEHHCREFKDELCCFFGEQKK